MQNRSFILWKRYTLYQGFNNMFQVVDFIISLKLANSYLLYVGAWDSLTCYNSCVLHPGQPGSEALGHIPDWSLRVGNGRNDFLSAEAVEDCSCGVSCGFLLPFVFHPLVFVYVQRCLWTFLPLCCGSQCLPSVGLKRLCPSPAISQFPFLALPWAVLSP